MTFRHFLGRETLGVKALRVRVEFLIVVNGIRRNEDLRPLLDDMNGAGDFVIFIRNPNQNLNRCVLSEGLFSWGN